MTKLVSVVILFGLVVSPFVMLQKVVMPQLNGLRDFYSNMDETAQKVADGANINTTQDYNESQ